MKASFSTWIRCRSSFEMQVALKLINSQVLRNTPKVNNGCHKLTAAIVFLRYILLQIEEMLGDDESRTFAFTVFMTTESCTTTSLMTTSNVKATCPNLKNNNNERLPVDR